MTYLQPYLSPLGPMTMAGDGCCLTGLWFDGQKYFPDLTADAYEWRDLPLFDDVRLWLADYFRGCRPCNTPPLQLAGSPFRQQVWKLLQEIPYGQTVTYRDIACQLARLQTATGLWLHRPSEALWVTTLSVSLFPATASSDATEA